MDSSPRPTFTYLRFLEVEISQFLNTLQVHLNELEVVQQEIQEVQSFLIERKADLDILQQRLLTFQKSSGPYYNSHVSLQISWQ
jgi:BMFP domain-containing protein YqiC